ncbi:hypothetical protein Q5P01_017057 [Channa striata]|uniref:U1-type domain-containing protein n=1 Tax=Channa striata TaxID=64152 RepID=A0AA88SIL8_CHASR|nr:hypothetical protein Q5P01_017057 [Channa striata]
MKSLDLAEVSIPDGWFQVCGSAGMKRPFSPSPVPNTELDKRGFGGGLEVPMDGEICCDTHNQCAESEEQSPGGAIPTAAYRPKRERKRRSYTLCEVCNIQLNSAAQAQIHYNGKSHQKRLKQISNGKMSSSTVYVSLPIRFTELTVGPGSFSSLPVSPPLSALPPLSSVLAWMLDMWHSQFF